MVLHFSSNLVFPLTNIFFFKMVCANTTLGIYGGVSQPEKVQPCTMFWYFEKTHIFTRRIVCALFHDAIFGHTFININKQLNWNVLQYTILCLQSILSVYLIINTNIQLSTFYHPQEIRSHYNQVYSVRYVNIS